MWKKYFNYPVGYLIRFERLKRCLSQEQFAERCEISPIQLSRIESGQCSPRKNTIKSIQQTFNIDSFRGGVIFKYANKQDIY